MALKAFRIALLGAVLYALAGCATLPSQTHPRAEPFDLLGRVLVSYEGRSFTANLRWLHAAQADDVWLMTPTGQALAQLREDAEGAVITTADQTQYRAGDVEALTRRALGWELPVTRLQYWVRGRAAPDSTAKVTQRDAAGKIQHLEQDGWRVSYEYYPPAQYDGLPRRMEINGAAQRMRLVIDTWRNDEL